MGEKESYVTNKGTGLKELRKWPIWYNLRFLDTLRFLPSSLEKLVKNLEKSQLKLTRKHFGEEKVDLMLRKGVYHTSTLTILRS